MHHDDAKHPTLLIVRGMPGGGKSFLATELLRSFGQEHVVMLDPDTIDFDSQAYKTHAEAQAAAGIDPKIFPFRYLKSQAFDGISSDKIIIWNQPFTNKGMFDRLVASLREHASEQGKELPVLLVEVEVDPATAKARVEQRIREGGHGPSDNTLNQRINDYVSYAGNGYQTVTIDGTDDIAASVAAVQAAMNRAQP